MLPDDIPSNGLGAESPRPQADPLPSKRGEIGYIELEVVEPPTDTLNVHDLPTILAVSDAAIPRAQSEGVVTCPTGSSDQLPSTASTITKPNGLLDLFKPRRSRTFGGLRLDTLAIFAVQLIILGGTVAAWVFASNRLARMAKEKHQTQPTIPMHFIFIVIILVQLVLLERLLFRLRGERYNYIHHGEILPHQSHHRNTPRSSMIMAFAPWNQPPLPTYAAALSQSGVATGDVEDHLIAGLPPPAYGNTQGSTPVLSGFPQNSLGRESGTSRPLSYVSRDEQSDQVQNSERVRRLEETMDRLEPPSPAYIAR